MQNNAADINGIKTCRSCNLRNELHKEPNSYNAFTFYYNHEQALKARYVFIMQNPLPYNPKELQKLNLVYDDIAFIEHHRTHLYRWLESNKFFLERFVKLMQKYKLIDYAQHEKFKEFFLEDFMFTDLVKCRATTGDLNKIDKKAPGICFKQHLEKELAEYRHAKLIFMFSSRTWDTLRNQEGLTEIGETNFNKNLKITQAHGRLFYLKSTKQCIIPAAHFSKMQIGNYLRNSYFDFFEEGIKKYVECDQL